MSLSIEAIRTVLVDATSINKRIKGVGRYALQLCEELQSSVPQDGKLLIATLEDSGIRLPNNLGVEVIQIQKSSEFKLGMHVFPKLLKQHRATTFIRPADKIGRDYGVRTLTVCHDLNPWIWAQWPPRTLKRKCIDTVWEYLRGHAMRHSDLVVCNSEFVRNGVIEHFGIDRDRTAIGYCGVDPRFPVLAPTASRTDLPWLAADQNFLLTFATGDSREGYDILPELFAAAKQSGYGGKLAIAGTRQDSLRETLLREFQSRKIADDIIWIPFLGADEFHQLAALYRFADFYLETSRHEGFGMQLVEAMACGTTCFSSGAGALSEIGGGFPLPLVIGDPEMAGAAIAGAWHNGAHDRDNREQVRHACHFDWSQTRRIVSEFAWGTRVASSE